MMCLTFLLPAISLSFSLSPAVGFGLNFLLSVLDKMSFPTIAQDWFFSALCVCCCWLPVPIDSKLVRSFKLKTNRLCFFHCSAMCRIQLLFHQQFIGNEIGFFRQQSKWEKTNLLETTCALASFSNSNEKIEFLFIHWSKQTKIFKIYCITQNEISSAIFFVFFVVLVLGSAAI